MEVMANAVRINSTQADQARLFMHMIVRILIEKDIIDRLNQMN